LIHKNVLSIDELELEYKESKDEDILKGSNQLLIPEIDKIRNSSGGRF